LKKIVSKKDEFKRETIYTLTFFANQLKTAKPPRPSQENHALTAYFIVA